MLSINNKLDDATINQDFETWSKTLAENFLFLVNAEVFDYTPEEISKFTCLTKDVLASLLMKVLKEYEDLFYEIFSSDEDSDDSDRSSSNIINLTEFFSDKKKHQHLKKIFLNV